MESLEVTPGFWKRRAVLVTGHTGFKGTWLCWWLSRLGARVTGFGLEPPTEPSLFESSGLGDTVASVRGDIRDAGAVHAAFQDHRPEVIFHMAAQSLVRESYREPAATFATNLMGTVNCLDAARRCESVRAIVVVTTDKCYRNRGGERGGFRETDELGGDDPYAASKACAEMATHAYRASFFENRDDAPRVASVRAGNVIGGGDWAADRLVPDAMRAFAAGRPLLVRHPGATRPWQHVLDPLRGYLMLAERLHAGDRSAAGAWNLGPDLEDVRPVSWMVDRLAARWRNGAGWERDNSAQPHEAADLALDSGKARAGLGWRPALRLEQALDWVVEWYQAFAAGGQPKALTLAQIERYEAMTCR